MSDQSLGCIGGLDEDLGATRISAAISVGRIEVEFPNDSEPVAGQQVESNTFMEGAIERFCMECAASVRGLPQQTLGGIRNLDHEFSTASVPFSACCDRLLTQARDDLRPIALQQIARQSFAKRVVEPTGHGSGAAKKRPLPNHAGRGPEERMPANRGVLARRI